MLVMGCPQFQAQDDLNFWNGGVPALEWECSPSPSSNFGSVLTPPIMQNSDIDPTIREILTQLQAISRQYQIKNQSSIPPVLTVTEVHDLANFVLHTLLQSPHPESVTSISEWLRTGLCIHMFVLHGPTYYSHAAILNTLVLQLQHQFEMLISQEVLCKAAQVWILSMGLVGSMGTDSHQWFLKQCAVASSRLGISDWDQIRAQLEAIAWLPHMMCEMVFRQSWDAVLGTKSLLPEARVKIEIEK